MHAPPLPVRRLPGEGLLGWHLWVTLEARRPDAPTPASAHPGAGGTAMSRPGVLLDRDGTIIADHGYVGSVDRVEFLDGAIEAIAALNRAGIPVAVVTNQAGVARGYYGIEDVHQVHKHMIEELARHGAHVDLWLFCPYHPDGIVEAFARASADRKPGPGMALAAAEALGLDLAASWVVGDSARATSGSPGRSARGRCMWGRSTFPDAGRPVVPRPRRRRRAHPRRHTTRTRRRRPRPSFPAAPVRGRRLLRRRLRRELARAAPPSTPLAGRAAELLNDAYDRDATVFACGNGGSASIANHLQCDHVKGVRNGTDLRARVQASARTSSCSARSPTTTATTWSSSTSCSHSPGPVTCWSPSRPRVGPPTSCGRWAGRADHGMRTISLTGFAGGAARELADVAVHVDSDNYGVIEDAHQASCTCLAQYVRQSRMTPDAVAANTF